MRRLVALLGTVFLVACSTGDHEDLREWMKTAAQDTKAKIPPLPVVEPYEPASYDVGGLFDPFKPAKVGPEEKKGGVACGLTSIGPKEPLELYPLESLKYVGVMTRNKVSYAIIQVEGTLYQIKIGNYMGQNFGVVVNVSEADVTLRELVQDSAGDWVERTSTLLLQEKGAK